MLIHVADPLYETLLSHTERTGESLRLKLFDAPTSVENLAYQLFSDVTKFGFRLNRLEVRETDTSVVIYTREDWIEDSRRPERRQSESRRVRRDPDAGSVLRSTGSESLHAFTTN